MTRVHGVTVPKTAIQHVGFGKVDFADAFQAPLTKKKLSIHQNYQAIFANQPAWVKSLMALRTWLVAPFGLKGSKGLPANYLELASKYQVGDKICGWEIYAQSEDLLVAGMNDKHLDFRVCLQRGRVDGAENITLSTIVKLNNIWGKGYLAVIMPFHKAIAKGLIQNAVSAGRI
tara:strand:- start:275 stop:796 length:522 start_codon:yes stop_codon:yes gene_type:complete